MEPWVKYAIIAAILVVARMAYVVMIRNHKSKNGDDMGVRGRMFASVGLIFVCAILIGIIEAIDGVHEEPPSWTEKLNMQ